MDTKTRPKMPFRFWINELRPGSGGNFRLEDGLFNQRFCGHLGYFRTLFGCHFGRPCCATPPSRAPQQLGLFDAIKGVVVRPHMTMPGAGRASVARTRETINAPRGDCRT
jgi:hypothetical protein